MNASLLLVCERLRADPVSACAWVIGNICWKGSVCVWLGSQSRGSLGHDFAWSAAGFCRCCCTDSSHTCLWEMAESEAGPHELLFQLVPARCGEYSLQGRCESCLRKCLPGFMLHLQSSVGSVQRAGGFQPYPGMELSPCSFLHPHLTCVLSSFKSTRKLSSCMSPFCIFSHPNLSKLNLRHLLVECYLIP